MEKTDDNCCCCEYIDNIIEQYEKHSGKIAIGLSILGTISSILVGKAIIAGSIAMAITNGAIFFSGLMTEKIVGKKREIEKDNVSLKNEMDKRMTLIDNFKFPQTTPTELNSQNAPDSNISTETYYEPIYIVKFNK